jgi:hypothetical protein
VGGACNVPSTRRVLTIEPSFQCRRKRILARTFSLYTTVKPLTLLARARRAAYENGATLVGDEHSGRFSHDLVKGDYRMVGQTVLVTITEKHWLVPWPVVESQLGALVR